MRHPANWGYPSPVGTGEYFRASRISRASNASRALSPQVGVGHLLGAPVRRRFGYGAVATVGGTLAGAGLLVAQVRQARRQIPRAEAPPPRTNGWYAGRRGRPALTMVVLGDSSAAGYGVDKPRQTPGALLATGISRRLGRPVRLYCLAVAGATSPRLDPQVEVAVELAPRLAVIIVGGNDITHRVDRATGVAHLAQAVRTLRGAGAEVVVGTCPDLGTIRPIPAPLRWLAGRGSRRLATAQTVAAVKAGAWTVSLGDLLAPRFAAEPHRMFGTDGFHPSAEGYAAAAAALLPTALTALGSPPGPRVVGQRVRSLPRAAAEASTHPGAEVSGVAASGSGSGADRRAAGRWAALRHRVSS